MEEERYLILLAVFVALLAPSTCQVTIYGEPCPVGLPQKSIRRCQDYRLAQLHSLRGKIQLAPAIPGLQIMPLINMTFDQMQKHFLEDPFERVEFMIYLEKTKGGSELLEKWKQIYGKMEITTMADYVKIYGFFRKAQKLFGTNFRLPSDEEPFRNVIQEFTDDQVFAEQRLAGLNPMALYRVSGDRGPIGLKWANLKLKLNPNFNWEKAVQEALGRNIPLATAIKNRLVFALVYPLLDNLPTVPDIREPSPWRKMWDSTSPIAIFVVDPGTRKNLKPAAIQLDSKQSSTVYTPKDKAMWPLAKMAVQGADLGYDQIVEHLAKTHLLMEPFCVSKERHLSEFHPLHQLLKYHCRGISVTDKLAFKFLLSENYFLHRLFPYGHKGALAMAIRAHQQTTWNDTDFEGNIKKRGLQRNTLTYFPYRDDGRSILNVIKRMVPEYINMCDLDVQKDYELQFYLNELSANGSGYGGGLGQIKGLPNKMSTKNGLIDLVKRLIWQMSAQHSAVNYPMTDYGAYTPNMPTKLYNDGRVPSDRFTLYNLPNANITANQALVALSLGNFRYDMLFDYGSELSHKPARKVVTKWFMVLQNAITRTIEQRNDERLREGHLTYPYLIPRWIPNGIQT